MSIDRSEEADARRFRWLLDGNSYFLQEERLCGFHDVSEEDKEKARVIIDDAMIEDAKIMDITRRCVLDDGSSLNEF